MDFGTTKKFPPLSMKQIVLIHLQNLSSESTYRGLYQNYERALDRLMNWLYWEFTEHHPDMKNDYEEVMDRDFGENVDAKKVAKRVRDKERLLSRMLALHNIHLGKDAPLSIEDLPNIDFSTIIPEEMTEIDDSEGG